MKLITSQTELAAEFMRLIREHSELHWLTAWAGVGSTPFQQLKSARAKIRRIVVGTHFFQTHPDFIQEFMDDTRVRFIKQPQGTFHPKLYLFYDDSNSWELLVGSANFTKEAFTRNTEATVLIAHDDTGGASILKATRAKIDECWDSYAQAFTQSELEDYRTMWQNQRPKLGSLSGQYGDKWQGTKPLYQTVVATRTWREFIERVKNDRHHSLSGRLAVIEKARACFAKYEHFSQMTSDERKFVAGLPNAFNSPELDAGWFGSMKGSGQFHSRIAANDANISRALDYIPGSGQVTRAHFDRFIHGYRKALDGNFLGTATRLLAMKRPDTFVCIDAKNKAQLCRDFGIPRSVSYERYWDEIVERIRDSEWWLNPQPVDNAEERVSDARAAFLDSLYYEGPGPQ